MVAAVAIAATLRLLLFFSIQTCCPWLFVCASAGLLYVRKTSCSIFGGGEKKTSEKLSHPAVRLCTYVYRVALYFCGKQNQVNCRIMYDFVGIISSYPENLRTVFCFCFTGVFYTTLLTKSSAGAPSVEKIRGN